MTDEQPTPDEAQERVEAAEEELEDAHRMQSQVARGGMPALLVKVGPDTVIRDEQGVAHGPGKTVALDGLTAMSMAQYGHGEIVGTHAGKLLHLEDPEAARRAGLEAEEKQLEQRLKENRAQQKKHAPTKGKKS